MTGQFSYILPPCTFTPPSEKEFGYWLNEETGEEYQPGENIFLAKNTTIRAVWKNGSGKTKIYNVTATSNCASTAVLHGPLKTPTITVTSGAPARILSDSSNLRWQKKVNGSWETQYSGRFTAGEWRVATQIRIDNFDAKQYELGTPTTLKVDGVPWTMENSGVPNVHYDFSMIAVYSPAIVIRDDPNIKPPEEVTKVNLSISGYQIGKLADDITVTSDHKGVMIGSLQFFEAEDTDNDGIPDNTIPAYLFKGGVPYMISFSLKAKDGYSISTLGMSDVTCNGVAAIGSYNAQEDFYYGICEAAPLEGCQVSFNAGGGKGTMAAVTVEKGSYTLPQNGFTAPDGKKFKAWSVDGKEQAPGSKITLTANITVTALWTDLPKDHICKPESVAKVEPTCTQDGKEAYYICKDCGKFYEDKDGKKAIADLSAWGNLEKSGHQDADQDKKCDVCGQDLTQIVNPGDINPSTPGNPANPDDPANPANPSDPSEPADPSDTEEAEKTDAPADTESDPTTEKNNLLWLWIVLPVVLLTGAGAAALVIIKKKSTKK
ncbi:MAG: InlB B-repeat-containing protein [Clostridia bacterium]|nr:InlB B-repeat-containing protein [Clostridia bacterium]